MREEENYWTNAARRRMTRRQVLKAAALAGMGLAGAGVVGCGSTSPQATPTAAGAKVGPTAATGAAPTPAKAVPTGSFIYAKSEDLGSPDGRILGSGFNWDYGQSVFEGLFVKDLEGKTVPGLAESMKVSEEGKALEFTLRKGVKWHNGDPFTAEDVRFTFESIFNPDLKSAAVSNFATLDKVEVVDDYHLTIRLKSPDATMPYNLEWYGLLVPAKYTKQVGDKEFAKKPIGTGPFKFVKWTPSESVELEAFADHWGRVPAIKNLTLKIVPEPQTRVAMLKTGEADMIGLSPAFVKDVESTSGLKVVRTPSLAVRQAMLNTLPAKDAANKAVPLRDKRVRLALNYAVDKKAILDTVYNGEGVITGSPIGPGAVGYDANLLAPYPFDPQKAKQLLADAGYAGGFDLDLVADPSSEIRKEAEAIAGFLNAVGVRAKVVIQDSGQMIEDIRQGRVPPVTVGWSATNPTGDAGTWLPRHPKTGGVWGAYSNPDLDKMISDSNAIYDAQERQKAMGQIMKTVHDEVPYIFLFAPNVFFGMKAKWDWQIIPGRYTGVWWNIKGK